MPLRIKFLLIFLVSSSMIALVYTIALTAIDGTNKFFMENELVTHRVLVVDIKTSWPVTVEKRVVEPIYVPVTTQGSVVKTDKVLTREEKEQIIQASDYPKIIKGIWILETNKGENNNPTSHDKDCAKVGMSNEFGYAALDNYCFGSFEESVKAVNKLIDDNLKKMSLSSLLCYYSSGTMVQTCDYAINFASLDKQGKLALN